MSDVVIPVLPEDQVLWEQAGEQMRALRDRYAEAAVNAFTAAAHDALKTARDAVKAAEADAEHYRLDRDRAMADLPVPAMPASQKIGGP